MSSRRSGNSAEHYPAPNTKESKQWFGRAAFSDNDNRYHKGENTGETLQVRFLLDLLCEIANEMHYDEEEDEDEKPGIFTHEDIKVEMAWASDTEYQWYSNHEKAYEILGELQSGDHWENIDPSTRSKAAHEDRRNRKVKLVFDDTDNNGYSEKAQKLIKVCQKEGSRVQRVDTSICGWEEDHDWFREIREGVYSIRYQH